MQETKGTKTRNKILRISEKLFALNGFDATSINLIAEKCKINKATIYFHFKSKDDIIDSMFKHILAELSNYLENKPENKQKTTKTISIENKISRELEFIESKQQILSVMMTESLKKKGYKDSLFQCAETIIKQELKVTHQDFNKNKKVLVHEFFTGFMPMIAFVLYQKQWANYFKVDSKELKLYFIDSFIESHIKSHIS